MRENRLVHLIRHNAKMQIVSPQPKRATRPTISKHKNDIKNAPFRKSKSAATVTQAKAFAAHLLLPNLNQIIQKMKV